MRVWQKVVPTLYGAILGMVIGLIVLWLGVFLAEWSGILKGPWDVYASKFYEYLCLSLAGILGLLGGGFIGARWGNATFVLHRYKIRNLLWIMAIIGAALALLQTWGPGITAFCAAIVAIVVAAYRGRMRWHSAVWRGSIAGFFAYSLLGPLSAFLPPLEGYAHYSPHVFGAVFCLPWFAFFGAVSGAVLGTVVWGAYCAIRGTEKAVFNRLAAGLFVFACLLGVAVLVVKAPALNEDLFFAVLSETDTEYAEDYSHFTWHWLKPGMSEQRVIDLVGQPLDIWSYGGDERWDYSRSPGDTHHLTRRVIFREGKVIEIDSRFYFD